MANVQHIGINPLSIRAKASGVGATKNFGVALAGADAMLGVASAAGAASNPTAGAVLSAAFGGISATGQTMGGMGGMGSMGMYASTGLSGVDTTGLLGGSGSSVIAGTEGYTQSDLINTMNQNNLQLLELQAMMQSNMQAWNTKSNILNADHRVKTTMIEKLSPR